MRPLYISVHCFILHAIAVTRYSWPCVSNTLYKVTSPLYACTVAYTGQVSFCKVQEKTPHFCGPAHLNFKTLCFPKRALLHFFFDILSSLINKLWEQGKKREFQLPDLCFFDCLRTLLEPEGRKGEDLKKDQSKSRGGGARLVIL